VGVDVSKATLDVYLSHPEQALRLAYDPTGITTLITTLREANPTLVVLEATGGLERVLVAELLVAPLPVAVVNRGKSAALPRPSVTWPRPTGWTPASSRTLPPPSSRQPARCRC